MRLIFKIFALFFALVVFCIVFYIDKNSIYGIDENENRTKIFIFKKVVYERFSKFNGKIQQFHKNTGKIALEYNIKNGLREGNHTIFYPNGQSKKIIQFKNNIPNGDFIGFYKNGNLKYKAILLDGKLHGKALFWYEDGLKAGECELNMDKFVYLTQYHQNGQLKLDVKFDKGEPIFLKQYDKNGSLMKLIDISKIAHAKFDKKNQTKYHKNGQIWFESIVKDGNLSFFRQYDENGNLEEFIDLRENF
nr:hypothetical protein [Campylobacter sp.]